MCLPPLVQNAITIDPKDPQWEAILSHTCLFCGPVAALLRRAGYNIRTHAEEEQGAVLLWMLSLYRDHGREWREKGQEKLNALKAANQEEQT
jgi:hypothetical protein